jgi:hypothetical protein
MQTLDCFEELKLAGDVLPGAGLAEGVSAGRAELNEILIWVRIGANRAFLLI